ncbi:MAG: agmatinase [Nanoarchaeota archaeon]|nr:agmatinase [Nanoarchaeota archaeon]MBU1005459.1 agmatinase [Nanoarchaeota archaeon]MBU1947029.1 agmatinase [Nanoarchaeota archaeon]
MEKPMRKLLNFGGSFETGDSSVESFSYEDSKIIILPVPFDITSTWIKGADKGPKAIIEASPNLEFYDIETDSEVYKKGIFTEKEIISANSSDMVQNVEEKVAKLIKDGKFVLMLGGDHSVSVGAIKAHASASKNLSVLHLDAHADSRDSYEGNKLSHACVIARAREYVKNVVSVGVRSMDSSEAAKVDKKKMFFAEKIYDSDGWIAKAVDELSENVYVTIDVDVFDPSIMPSTGTPEPGGLNWHQAISLLKEAFKKKNIVGVDVVELCPSENKAPDFMAAKLIYKILSYKFFNSK